MLEAIPSTMETSLMISNVKVDKDEEEREREQKGLKEMKMLNKEFLATNIGSEKVLDFMSTVGDEKDVMLVYLRGRKYQPEHAWETLKRYAEVRFDKYPEVFDLKPPSFYNHFQDIGLWGVLKNKDKLGRTIFCVMGNKWNTSEFNMADLTNGYVGLLEKIMMDKDVLEDGVVFVANCEGMGLGYAKHFGLNDMLRLVNVLWYACPLKIKEVYIVNVNFGLTFLYTLIKPFLSKKLKERIVITTQYKKFSALHSNLDPKILPVSFGGKLDHKDAYDLVKFRT